MKTFLFILFFPITVPVWLLYEFLVWFFEWLGDTFIPFLRYDVFPAIKRYFRETSAKMEKNAEKLKQEREKDKQEKNKITRSTPKAEDNIIIQNPAEPINQESIAEEIIEIPLEVSVSVNSSFDDIIGHGPPFTAEEYKKLRRTETEQQCRALKECYNVNDFSSQWECARIYEFWGAKYRLLAIYHYEKCIKLSKDGFSTFNLYTALGSLYEKSRDFEKAINAYNKVIEDCPYSPTGYVCVAKCLRKQNKLDEAVKFLENAKTSDYYTSPEPHSCFNTCVDSKLQDLYKKKEKGYIFRPKKDSFEYYDYSMTIDEICNSYMQNWI